MTDNSPEATPTDEQSAADAVPVSVDIGVSSNAPPELLDRVTAMAEDLDRLGIDVTLELIRTCRVCGCTDERACLGGCWWLDDQDDICSSCAPSAGAVVDARARFAHREGSERSDGAEGAGGQQDEGD